MFSPAIAGDITIGASIGSSTYSYDYSYPYENYNGDATTLQYDEEIDFVYRDLSLSFSNDAGGTWTLKLGGLPEENDYNPYYEASTAERSENSITFTKQKDNNWAWFIGYYSSEAELFQSSEDYIFGEEYEFKFTTNIDTGGVFGGITYTEPLNDKAVWFARGAIQSNWTSFSDNYEWENESGVTGGEPFNRDLEGFAFLLGLGVYLPVDNNVGISLSLETKTYDYDNELEYLSEGMTTLSEDQTSLILSFSYGI